MTSGKFSRGAYYVVGCVLRPIALTPINNNKYIVGHAFALTCEVLIGLGLNHGASLFYLVDKQCEQYVFLFDKRNFEKHLQLQQNRI